MLKFFSPLVVFKLWPSLQFASLLYAYNLIYLLFFSTLSNRSPEVFFAFIFSGFFVSIAYLFSLNAIFFALQSYVLDGECNFIRRQLPSIFLALSRKLLLLFILLVIAQIAFTIISSEPGTRVIFSRYLRPIYSPLSLVPMVSYILLLIQRSLNPNFISSLSYRKLKSMLLLVAFLSIFGGSKAAGIGFILLMLDLYYLENSPWVSNIFSLSIKDLEKFIASARIKSSMLFLTLSTLSIFIVSFYFIFLLYFQSLGNFPSFVSYIAGYSVAGRFDFLAFSDSVYLKVGDSLNSFTYIFHPFLRLVGSRGYEFPIGVLLTRTITETTYIGSNTYLGLAGYILSKGVFLNAVLIIVLFMCIYLFLPLLLCIVKKRFVINLDNLGLPRLILLILVTMNIPSFFSCIDCAQVQLFSAFVLVMFYTFRVKATGT